MAVRHNVPFRSCQFRLTQPEESTSTMSSSATVGAGGAAKKRLNPRTIAAYIEPPVPRKILSIVVFMGLCGFVEFLRKQETNRMTRFRDKSSLYQGLNPDPENNPSWGPKEFKYRVSEW